MARVKKCMQEGKPTLLPCQLFAICCVKNEISLSIKNEFMMNREFGADGLLCIILHIAAAPLKAAATIQKFHLWP